MHPAAGMTIREGGEREKARSQMGAGVRLEWGRMSKQSQEPAAGQSRDAVCFFYYMAAERVACAAAVSKEAAGRGP